MESTDKLREWARRVTESNPDENIVSPEFVAHECGRTALRFADEIEREIAERYMELPVDAEGVPIRPREEVSTGMGDNGPIGHLEYWYPNHWVAVMEYKPGQFTRYDPAAIRHYKPRTIEDVLTDFAYKVCDMNNIADTEIKRYAVELRELMGVRDE